MGRKHLSMTVSNSFSHKDPKWKQLGCQQGGWANGPGLCVQWDTTQLITRSLVNAHRLVFPLSLLNTGLTVLYQQS